MRFTALCLCGTLLLFSSLSWTAVESDEGDLQRDHVFGPCTVTLRPEGLCRQDQDGDTCSYLISLPPLTVYLPKQLRDLEKIVKDLQNLKDNVDQLRKMCADCTVSQTESEHEKRNDGMDRHEDEMIWLNDRNNDKQKDLIKDYGTIRGIVANTTEDLGGNNNEEKTSLDEKMGIINEPERKTIIELLRENNDEESIQVAKPYGDTEADGTKGKDQSEKKTITSAYGNERIEDATMKNTGQNNSERETIRNKQYGKVSSIDGREKVLLNVQWKKITNNIKNNNTEESFHHLWKDQTKKTDNKTSTDHDRGNDGIKTSEGHDKHINIEGEQPEEERKMQKGIKVEPSEKPIATEISVHTEKEETIKEGEVQVKDREIRVEVKKDQKNTIHSVQRDHDGGFSKAKEKTDFVSTSLTPYSSRIVSQRHDSTEAPLRFPLSSSKSRLSSGVNQGVAITPDGLLATNTDPGAARITEHHSTDMEADLRTTSRLTKAAYSVQKTGTVGGPSQQTINDTTRFATTTTAGPEAGHQRQIGHPTRQTTTTTAPPQNLYITTFPRASDHSGWTQRMNIASETVSSVDPLGVHKPTLAGKRKSAAKPIASQKHKSKNGNKSDQPPLSNKMKKTKDDQKQKSSNQKSATNKKNKPDQRLTKTQLQKPNLNLQIPKQEYTIDQSQLPVQKPKSHQKSVQQPKRARHKNTTRSDENPPTQQEPEPAAITTVKQHLKPDKSHLLTTEEPAPKPNPHQKSTIAVQRPTPRQKPKTIKETGSDKDRITNQEPEPVAITTVNPNLKIGENLVHLLTADEPTQKPKLNQKSFPPVQRMTSYQKPKTIKTTGSEKDPPTGQEPELVVLTTVNQNLKPDKNVFRLKTEEPAQKPEPPQKSSPPVQRLTTHQKSESVKETGSDEDPPTVQEPEPIEITTHNQNLKPDKNLIHLVTTEEPVQTHEMTTVKPEEPVQKPKPRQNSTIPVQRPTSHRKPKTIKTTSSDKDPPNGQEPEHVKLTTVNQKLKSDKNLVHLKTKEPAQKPEPHQKSSPPVQRKIPHQKPKTIKTTVSDNDRLADEEPEPVEITTFNQNLKPDENLVHLLTTEEPVQTQKFHQKTLPPVQRLAPHQKPETAKTIGSKKDPLPDQKPDPVEVTTVNQEKPAQKPEPHQKSLPPVQSPTPLQKPKRVNATGSNKDTLPGQEPEPVEITTVNQNLKLDANFVHLLTTEEPAPKSKVHQKSTLPLQRLTPLQKPKRVNATGSNKDALPDQEPEPDEMTTVNQKEPVKESKSHRNSTLSVQRSTPHQKPKTVKETGSDKDPLTGQEPEPDGIITFSHNMKPNENLVHFLATEEPAPKLQLHQKSSPPVQKLTPHQGPKSVNESSSHKDSPTDQEPEPVEITTFSQNLKPSENNKHDQKPHQKLTREEITKSIQMPPFSHYATPVPESQPNKSAKSFTSSMNQKPIPELLKHFEEKTDRKSTQESPRQKLTPDHVVIKTNEENQKHADVTVLQKTETVLTPQPEQTLPMPKALQTDQMPQISKSVPDDIHIAEPNKTSRVPPRLESPNRPRMAPGTTPSHKSNPSVQRKPGPKTKTTLDPSHITTITPKYIQSVQTDATPSSDHINLVTHSPSETKSSSNEMKTITPDPKASYSMENKHLSQQQTHPEGFTMRPNSRIISNLRLQTASQPSRVTVTRRPTKIMLGIPPSVTPSTRPGSRNPNHNSYTHPRLQVRTIHHVEETVFAQSPDPPKMLFPVPFPKAQTSSTTSPKIRPKDAGLRSLVPEASTPSARELRVKINQVAAVLSASLKPNDRPVDHPTASRAERTDDKPPAIKPPKVAMRDCTDYLLRGETKSGVYVVTPDLRSRSFAVYCDMKLDGGGWTVLQHRQDGSVNFNRTWNDYKEGFGKLDGGEFWLGNNMIHLLTRDRDMVLHVELEDFDGVKAYAHYERFRVASERLRFRLTVGEYSGTAGDALCFNKRYDHNNRSFTTPDRDHDRYPSGNCGAYYSSGWWFDACLASNLNGRYYVGKYKGVRDGIFWGTWHNINKEYYPTNDRQSFKSVRMMIRPKGFSL